jgi:hypothetical protein
MGFLAWLRYLLKPPQQYGTPSLTLTGQPVKSKAEKAIADYLTRHNITYQYEAQAMTKGWLIKDKISKPDFYLPQYNLFIEYWGLVDSPDRRTRDKYIQSMRWKMAQYHRNNIAVLSIYPSNLSSLDYYFRKKFRDLKGFDPSAIG